MGVYINLPRKYPRYYPHRDFQRSRVYKWEQQEGLFNGSPVAHLTMEQCEALVNKYWRLYRPDDYAPPEVLPGHGCRRATGSSWRIQLPIWARKVATVLHETAHAVAPWSARHGPAWLCIYLEMLEMEGAVNARGESYTFDALARSARTAGLRIAPMCACPRPSTRRARQTDEEVRAKARIRVRAWREAKLRRKAELGTGLDA